MTGGTAHRERNPELSTWVAQHSALSPEELERYGDDLVVQIERCLDPPEAVLAYADRRGRPPGALPLDLLLASDRQLMRLIVAETNGFSGAGEPLSSYRLHLPRRFLEHLDLQIFLTPEDTFPNWDVTPAIPHVHIRLPPALRVGPHEEWWNWEPPERGSRRERQDHLLHRAAIWRRAEQLYRERPGGEDFT